MKMPHRIKRLFDNWQTGSNPLQEQQTEDEARVGLLHREFAEHVSNGITPTKLYQVLEAAEHGDLKAQHELFLDMEEKDAQIASDLGVRVNMAAELEWQIKAPDNASAAEQKAADWANEVFTELEVEDLIINLGAGVGHGWANLEQPWELREGRHQPQQPIFRPHSWFRLHTADQNKLMLRDNSSNGAELWNGGWVQHRHRAKAGYVARSGLHRVLAWPYLFQNYALADLAELLEIYGIPARLGKFPTNASPDEKATLLRAVTTMGHRAAGIIPEGMSIEYLEAADGKSDMFEAMLNWCERAKAKAILGGSLTSGTGEGTNTNALGNVHERTTKSLIRSDVRQYSSSITEYMIWPMMAFNGLLDDRRRCPRFYLETKEPEDLKLLSESLPTFVSMGMQIPTWYAHEVSGIPQATEQDEVLQPPKPEPTEPTEPPPATASLRHYYSGTMTALKSRRENDTPETLADQLEAETAEPLRVWFEQIRAMAEQADDLADLRDTLLAAYGDLDDSALQEVMALAFSVADGIGREAVQDEVDEQ